MYAIICVAYTGGCADYAPRKPWLFRSQRECIVFVNKVHKSFLETLKEKGLVITDSKAFCLRFKETKET
ncbi:hypothetical protein LCGC14_3031650 [marine sediment metagenome]|uniref:Uncharacterized protein n=1 Tax=marine sediment metagenome TaxID=412755 RepID=A0A0F8WS24_9ZZZZ